MDMNIIRMMWTQTWPDQCLVQQCSSKSGVSHMGGPITTGNHALLGDRARTATPRPSENRSQQDADPAANHATSLCIIVAGSVSLRVCGENKAPATLKKSSCRPLGCLFLLGQGNQVRSALR